MAKKKKPTLELVPERLPEAPELHEEVAVRTPGGLPDKVAFGQEFSDRAIAAMALKFKDLTVAGLEDREGLALVHDARIQSRNVRVAIEKKRKELKADALRWGRMVDEEAARLTALIEPIEERLASLEEVVEIEKERIRQEQIAAQRVKFRNRLTQLNELGAVPDDPLVLTEESDADFENRLIVAQEAAAERKALAEREAAAEAQRKAEEAAQRAAEERQAAAARAEAERVAALERKRAAEEAAAELAKAEAFRAETERQLALERAETERLRREAVERDAAAARDRRAAEERAAQEQRRLQAEIEAFKAQELAREQAAREEAERVALERLAPARQQIRKLAASIRDLAGADLCGPYAQAARAVQEDAARRLERMAATMPEELPATGLVTR